MDFLFDTFLTMCAGWVLCACVWRLNLLQWGKSQCMQMLSYICIALWAASYILGVQAMQAYGIAPIALLFLGGRKRWLIAAPDDTRR